MPLSKEDVERLERVGFSREDFTVTGGYGLTRLRNVEEWYYFYDPEEKNVDKAGRHRSGLSMGFPVRQAGRHHMAIQKKSSRMAKKERIPEDLTKEFSAHVTSNFSPLAVFKSRVNL